MRAILCPVDFSDASRNALRAAARFVREFHGTLHVLFVQDPMLAATAAQRASVVPALDDELQEFVASTCEGDLPSTPRFHVVTGEPATEIVRIAECERVDAIVMGTHGLTGEDKAFFGSTTARVLRRATTTLVVIPASTQVDKAENLSGVGPLLVLTDFGAAAATAATVAARLAGMIGSAIVVVHVLPRMSAPPSWDACVHDAMKRRDAEAHRCMCGVIQTLEHYGPVETIIVEGNIASAVAELARQRHAGLIVMGLEGDGHESRPGSTAYAMICATPVPVLAVPAAKVPD